MEFKILQLNCGELVSCFLLCYNTSMWHDVTNEYLDNAAPGVGRIIYADGYIKTAHKDEIMMAEWLFSTFGGTIILLKEKYVETADYEWNGRLWELKIPEKKNSISKRIQKGLSQIYNNAGGIIVDVSRLNLSIEVVTDIIDKRMITSMKHETDIILVKKSSLQGVLRYKR